MPDKDPAGSVPTGTGPGRAIVAVYAFFALAAGARAASTIITRFSEAPLAYSLSAFSAVVYLLAAIALARNARWVAALTIGIELVGVLAIGTVSLLLPDLFPADTVWSTFGMGYLFIPLVLPVIGLSWLIRTSWTTARS